MMAQGKPSPTPTYHWTRKNQSLGTKPHRTFSCPVKIVVVEMLPKKMPISNTTTSHCKHGSPPTRTLKFASIEEN